MSDNLPEHPSAPATCKLVLSAELLVQIFRMVVRECNHLTPVVESDDNLSISHHEDFIRHDCQKPNLLQTDAKTTLQESVHLPLWRCSRLVAFLITKVQIMLHLGAIKVGGKVHSVILQISQENA